MKRILSLLLALALILTCVPATPVALAAASGTCGTSLSWSLSDAGTLTISGNGDMTDYSSSNTAPWYASRYSIKKVSIGNGVTSIGNYAFSYCTNLQSITFGSKVARIGDHAFFDCEKLTVLTLPSTLTTIGKYAFGYCYALTKITLPNSVTTLGQHVFSECNALESVTLSSKLTEIPSSTFSRCYALKTITIPNNVTTIGTWAFNDCTGLTQINLGTGVTSVGNHIFSGCTALTSVTIPKQLTNIGYNAFSGCDSLTGIWVDAENTTYCSDSYGVLYDKRMTHLYRAPHKLSGSYTIPTSVATVGECAFQDCTGLTSVTIPDSVAQIVDFAFCGTSLTTARVSKNVFNLSYRAFARCSNLTGIWVDAENTSYCNDASGVLFNKDKTILMTVPGALSGTYTAPDTITTVKDSAFEYCKNVKQVNLPDTVTSMGSSCFSRSGLESFRVPAGITKIGTSQFYACSKLTSITIPTSVTEITGYAFYDCRALTDVYYTGTLEQWNAIKHGSNEYLTNATLHTSCGDNLTWTLDSSGTLTISGTGAMADYTSSARAPWYNSRDKIIKIVINSGVTTIGTYAFDGCAKAEQVVIPDTVTEIRSNAFSDATSLKTVTIPEGVTTIGAYSFVGCQNMTSISLPSTLRGELSLAFQSCTSLTAIQIPEGVTGLGSFLFNNCSSLKSITLPSTLTTIGNCTFNNCRSLQTITIPTSVTKIELGAFGYCTGLTDVYYEGTRAQWNAIAIDRNEYLTNATLHTIAEVTSITVKTPPAKTYYLVGESLDTTGLVLSVSYTDGSNADITEGFTITGFDSIAVSNQTLTITYEGCTTSFQIEVTYGGSCGENLTWTLDSTGILTISGAGDMYDYAYDATPWDDVRNSIQKVVIESGVTSIGGDAFLFCESLTEAIIPGSVTSIGSGAFSFCVNLINVTILDGVASIGGWAFNNCQSLTEITIPASVTTVDEGSFYDCDNLTDVYFEGTQSQWDAINIDSDNANLLNATLHIGRAVTGLGIYNSPEKLRYLVGEELDTTGLVLNVTYSDGSSKKITDGFAVSGFDSSAVGKETITVTYEGFTATFAVTVMASGTCGDNLTWLLDETGTLTISGTGKMTDYIDTGDAPWYALQRSIQKIVIEEGVTSIGRRAFEECLEATSVDIPEGIAAIGDYAFALCTELTEIKIPNSTTTLGLGVFESCESITTIHIPDSITSIGDTMFLNCIALTEVNIPAAVTSIGNHAFGQCYSLKKLHIPASVAHIGEYVFACCPELEQITVDSDNPYFCDENGVLFDKDKSVLLCYPGGKAGSYAIPNTVGRIGGNAFSVCEGLTDLIVPESIIAVDDYAFEECPVLTDVYFAGTEAQREIISFGEGNDVLTDAAWHYITDYGSCGDDLVWFVDGNTLYILGSGDMDDFTEGAPWDAYSSQITHLEMDDTVTTIGSNAFRALSELTFATLPDGLLRIGDYAFYGSRLSTLTLPQSLTTIGMWAFGDCDHLTTVTVPQSVTTLGTGAFAACNSLIAIYVTAQNASYAAVNGCLYDKAKTRLLQVPGAYTGTLNIPATVTTIGMNAFRDCGQLKTVTLPDSVTVLEDAAFYGSSVTEVAILGAVRYIPFATFQGCGKLKKLTLPASLTVIDASALSGCTALGEVYFRGTSENWAQMRISSGNDALQKAIIHFGERNDHGWDNGTVTLESTCVATGLMVYRCKACAATRTEDLPISTDHIYTDACDPLCDLCNTPRVAPHIYDNNCDPKCNGCELERTITHVYEDDSKTCAVCRLPLPPVVVAVTHNSVTLEARANRQYSLDGVNWQNSPIFIGLQPNTVYTFCLRYTDGSYTGPVSEACTVTTPLIPGDVTGDGSVANNDVLYLLWNTLFGDEEYPLNQSGDVNGDSNVDNNDVLYLLWNTLFGNAEYPLYPTK